MTSCTADATVGRAVQLFRIPLNIVATVPSAEKDLEHSEKSIM